MLEGHRELGEGDSGEQRQNVDPDSLVNATVYRGPAAWCVVSCTVELVGSWVSAAGVPGQ